MLISFDLISLSIKTPPVTVTMVMHTSDNDDKIPICLYKQKIRIFIVKIGKVDNYSILMVFLTYKLQLFLGVAFKKYGIPISC